MSNKTTPPKLAYSINEACKASSIGKTMIYALIKAGSLKVVHIGGRTIIPADSLHALIENGSPYSRARPTCGLFPRSRTLRNITPEFPHW